MNVIVCGAGIAGLATALRLSALDVRVTVLERAAAPRDQGYMIDLFGPGLEVLRAGGLLPMLRERGYQVTSARYRDARGRERARISYDSVGAALGDGLVSIMRPDLESVLREALPPTVQIRYGSRLQGIDRSGDGVTVTTADGDILRADLLIGADGIHSTVRELIFGPERDFLHYLGYHTAAYTFADPELSRQLSAEFALTDSVNRMLGCYGLRDDRVAVFAVHRTPDPTMPGDARAAIRQTYAGLGWVTPQLLLACPPASAVYYDQVAQVRMPHWINGRVALVGDACYAVSLLAGQGASMAIAGGQVLAERIASAAGSGDLQAALHDYQNTLRPMIEDRQRSGRRTARWFVPASRSALAVRRVMLAGARLPGINQIVTRRLTGKPSAILAEARAVGAATAKPSGGKAPVTSKRPTGLLRWALRLPIWLYRAHLGWILGHRLVYLAHRGRTSGQRREVVVEAVRFDPATHEVTVIAAWGGIPQWYRNLRAAPAIEVRTGRNHWVAPHQRFLDAGETLRVLKEYQRAHPAAFRQIGPRLGFPADPGDPAWPAVAARVHAVAFGPPAVAAPL